MFIMIPNKALELNISKSALILLGLIISLNNATHGCLAHNSYFAKKLKCSIPSINRYLVELENEKLIKRKEIEREGKSSIRIIVPTSKILNDLPTAEKTVKYNMKNKNRLPKDIESDWFDEYLEKL